MTTATKPMCNGNRTDCGRWSPGHFWTCSADDIHDLRRLEICSKCGQTRYIDITSINERVASNVARIRRERGLTQKALAEQMHMHDTAVVKIERPTNNPTLHTLKLFADALNVTVADLVS